MYFVDEIGFGNLGTPGAANDCLTNPELSNVAITDVNENGVAVLTGNAADAGTQDSLTLAVDWGDGSPVSTYSYPAGTATFTETHRYLDDNPSGTASDPYTVGLTLTDDGTGVDMDSVTVTVANLNPTLSNVAITDLNENGVAVLTGNAADAGTQDSLTLAVDWGDGSPVSTYSYPAGTAAFTETHQYLDDNPSGTASDPYMVGLTLTDDDTGVDVDSVTVVVANVNPVLSADVLSQAVQYSDLAGSVTITATDVAGDSLMASTGWNMASGFAAGLPDGMSMITNGCDVSGNSRTCAWTLSGIDNAAAGAYIVRVTVEDDDLGQSIIDIAIVLTPEDATVAFDGDNPVAVQVTEPDSNASLPFEMVVYIEELEPDQAAFQAAAGDITLADVSMILEPVGPGGGATGDCLPALIDDAVDDYGDVLKVICTFTGVQVNTYSVNVLVDGGYYAGSSEDVLVIYDSSLGFTAAGGWFYWPGTADPGTGYLGDKTNFGYSMSYNQKNLKNVKGSLLLIRHLADGTKYRVKSNAVEGLSIGDAGPFGWASFSGKATYMAPELEFWDATLGQYVPIGNYTFLVYVEDHNEPGNGTDEFWIEVREPDNKGGEVVGASSLARPGSADAVPINQGNIVVPHRGGTNNQPPDGAFSYAVDDLTVTFTDLSSDPGGEVASWLWEFGDGTSDATQDPIHNYATAGSYDVTLTVTDSDGGTGSVTHQVTVSSGGATAEMYVGDLSYISTQGIGSKWNVHVTIPVLDDLGNPVANAQVLGSWSNGASGSGNCVTDASGFCTVTMTNINGNRSSVTFTVDDVTHATQTYNAALNVESTIVVSRP